MSETDIEKKIIVLNYSLQLEEIASKSLAYLLDIEDTEDSKSLGNTNTTLSFNQKINLLLDSKSIVKEEKIKFDIFMSIRNQFMHNLNINTFSDAYDKLTGTEKKLRMLYPKYFLDEFDRENSFINCFKQLYLDNLKCLATFKGARENKIALMSKSKIYKKLYDNTPFAIEKSLKELKTSIINKEFDYTNKDELFANIDILKMQIIVYTAMDL